MQTATTPTSRRNDAPLATRKLSTDELAAAIRLRPQTIRASLCNNGPVHAEVLLATQRPGVERIERVLRKGDVAVTREHERHALKGLLDAEVLILTRGPRAGSQYEDDTHRLAEPLIAP